MDTQRNSLLLMPQREDLDTSHDPSLVARRQQHAKFTSSVKMNLVGSKDSRDAGLVAFQNETHNFFIGVHQSEDGTRKVFLERRNGDVSQPASEVIPAGAKEITFKVSSTSAKYQFYYQLDGKAWKQLGDDQDGTILSTKKAGGFVGTYIGVFARTANVNSQQPH
jgi:alpha-N-arabinofuranosidase